MESPGKDMRLLEEQLDRLGNQAPGLKVTFADAAGGDLPDAPGGGDGGAGEAPKELTKLERKAAFEAQNAGREKKKPTKEERREKQGEQRKAKGIEPEVVEEPVAPPVVARTPSMSKMMEGDAAKGSSGLRLQHDDPKAMAKAKRHQALLRTEVQKKVPWFQHLPQYEREASLSARLTQRADGDIHPEVLKLGLKFAEWMIVGGNARTRTMLMAFSRVVADYSPPKDHETGADVSRHLDGRLKPMISYLVACRPLSIGMGNAIRCDPNPERVTHHQQPSF
jgi:translation initiation factor eIF-2B subunit delta